MIQGLNFSYLADDLNARKTKRAEFLHEVTDDKNKAMATFGYPSTDWFTVHSETQNLNVEAYLIRGMTHGALPLDAKSSGVDKSAFSVNEVIYAKNTNILHPEEKGVRLHLKYTQSGESTWSYSSIIFEARYKYNNRRKIRIVPRFRSGTDSDDLVVLDVFFQFPPAQKWPNFIDRKFNPLHGAT